MAAVRVDLAKIASLLRQARAEKAQHRSPDPFKEQVVGCDAHLLERPWLPCHQPPSDWTNLDIFALDSRLVAMMKMPSAQVAVMNTARKKALPPAKVPASSITLGLLLALSVDAGTSLHPYGSMRILGKVAENRMIDFLRYLWSECLECGLWWARKIPDTSSLPAVCLQG